MNRALFSLVFALLPGVALAYPGQPKSMDCKIAGAQALQLVFNDVPAKDIKPKFEHWKNICSDGTLNRIPLHDGPFQAFRFNYIGCKKVGGRYVVQPTHLDASFYRKVEGGILNAYIRWTGNSKASLEYLVEDSDGNEVQNFKTRCDVTAFH